MAYIAAARAIHCELQQPKQGVGLPRVVPEGSDQVKIVLQPRLCTLRLYGPSDRGSGVIKSSMMIKTTKDGSGNVIDAGEELMSPFLSSLYEYIESSKKSQDFEIITGRLAMIVFAATIGVELTTGNSVFKKMDVQGIAEGVGACVAAVSCAAAFAYSSSARKNVGEIFTLSCNAFIDTLIDNIIDGLFYESEDVDDEQSSGKDI